MRLAFVPFILLAPVAASAADLTITVTNQPPYMIEADGTGIFIDLIKDTFSAAGHTVKTQFLPNRRAFVDFEDKKVDGVFYYVGDKGQGSCKTENYGNYQTTLITLKKNNIKISSFADLSGRKVSAFFGATELFAPIYPDYAGAIKAAAEYREEADITRITKLLLSDRLDVGLFDWRIFLWTAKADAQGTPYGIADAEQHPILPPSLIALQMHKQQYCDDFNKGLAALKADGRYDRIYKKYIDAMMR